MRGSRHGAMARRIACTARRFLVIDRVSISRGGGGGSVASGISVLKTGCVQETAP
jgi:hypothetical protein